MCSESWINRLLRKVGKVKRKAAQRKVIGCEREEGKGGEAEGGISGCGVHGSFVLGHFQMSTYDSFVTYALAKFVSWQRCPVISVHSPSGAKFVV